MTLDIDESREPCLLTNPIQKRAHPVHIKLVDAPIKKGFTFVSDILQVHIRCISDHQYKV